jgi:hypothetical protein
VREAYHDRLDDLAGELAEMCDHVRDALADATTAVARA